MDRRHQRLLASAAALVLSAGAAAPAVAEGPATAPPAAPQVAEVVVTAQKREQSLQKVPLSVTALTATTLTQAGVVDMQGVSALSPALTAQESNGPQAQSYHIRGIGSSPDIPTFEPDVALFIDGVYLPRSGLSVDELVDLARIEVIEGPQSTLYGKNATAGVINIVTRGPSRTFEASVEGTASALDGALTAPAYRVAGTVSGPITDHLRARLSAVGYAQGDTFKNLYPGAPNANDMHRYSVRGELEADLWAGATLRIDASRSEIYNTRTGDGDLKYYAYPGQPGGPNLPYLIESGARVPLCPDNDPGDRVICTSSPYQASTFSNILSATLNSKVGPNSFTSITALTDYQTHVVDSDIVQVMAPVAAYNDIMKGGAFSQEFRLTSPTGDKLEWLAGLYVQHTGFARGNDGNTPMFVTGPAAPFIPLLGLPFANPAAPTTCGAAFCLGKPGDEGFVNSKSRSTYGAGFGQATWHFDDRFALTLGARAQGEQKHASVDNRSVISPTTPGIPLGPCGFFPLDLMTVALTPTALPGPTGCPLSPVNSRFSHSTGLFTWNATGEYHPGKDTMLYVTVSRGAKAFGYNIGFGNALLSQRPFKDEYVYNYEAGVKTTLFHGRARLAASVFRADYTNYQNASFVGLQFLVNNAQKASTTGAEATGSFALGRGFSVDASAAYIDARYDTYSNGSCYWWAPGAPCGPPKLNAAGTGCDMSGKTMPQSPRWRTALGVAHHHPSPFGDVYSRVDWVWQSSQLSAATLDPRSYEPAYSLVNARLGLKMANGLDVSLWGKNLFNQVYDVEAGVSDFFGPSDPAYQRFLGNPREYGVTLRKSFF